MEDPSPRLLARPGKSIAKQSEGRAGEKYLPVGGRVKKSRAVEGQSAPIPEERTSKLGGMGWATWSSSCSRNARPQKDLVRRAQSRIDQAAL